MTHLKLLATGIKNLVCTVGSFPLLERKLLSDSLLPLMVAYGTKRGSDRYC